MTAEEILRDQKAASDVRLCLAAEMGTGQCRGRIVKAHSLSRRASLERIARNQHVYGVRPFTEFLSNEGRLIPRLVGIRNASTFTGFCEEHDRKLFRPVDAHPIIPTREQIGLLAYRALCREVFSKFVLTRTIPLLRGLDRGKSLSQQMFVQGIADELVGHLRATVPTLARELQAWHDVILKSAYERVSFVVIRFQSLPQVLCAGVSQPHRDFADRLLLDLRKPETRQDNVAFVLIPADSGGIAFFAWLDALKEAEEFVDSLLKIPEERIGCRLVRYAFETFENVWLSPNWWEGLPQTHRDFLVHRMSTGNLPDGTGRNPYSLRDNGMEFVQWKVLKVEKLINAYSRSTQPF